MTENPYSPPRSTLRDIAPGTAGPLPDVLAILLALGLTKLLTMHVAEMIAGVVFFLLPFELMSDVPFLVFDVVLSFAFEFWCFWLAWRWSRSRAFAVPLAVATLSLLGTVMHRWFLNDFGWPQWYEYTLLTLAPLALLLVWYTCFRRRSVPA